MGERIAVPKGRCWIALNTSGFSIKPKAPPPILTRNSRTIDKLLYDT